MKRAIYSIFVAMLIFCFSPEVSFAESPRIGGYDVSRIATSTLGVLKAKGVLNSADTAGLAVSLNSAKGSDPLVASQSIVEFYGKLGAILIEKKTLMAEDVESAKIQARESGGIKAGGLNPVVLAASFLDALIQKEIVSVDAAQTILDGAKERNL